MFTILQLTLRDNEIRECGTSRRHLLGNIPEVWEVAGENVSDNWYAFICSVTGALILSNVKLCGEMNGGIGLD